MFNQEVDVAKIMQEIKSRIQPEDIEEMVDLQAAVVNKKIEIVNAREIYYPYINIGERLPGGQRFPKFMRKLVHFAGKIVRRMNKFIIYDQRIVNQNVDTCISEIVTREDYIIEMFNNSIRDLELNNRSLKGEVDLLKRKVLELQEEKDQILSMLDEKMNN